MRRVLLLSLGVALANGCGDDFAANDAPLYVEEGCQPLLAGTAKDEVSQATCMLPYPSNTPVTAKLVTVKGKTTDPRDAYRDDGASTIPMILATLPSPLVRDGLPGVTGDPATTLRADSATVLIEADTGAFVAHYTDLSEDEEDGRHAGIAIRPIAPLHPKTRYIAAIAGARLADGTPAPPPEGFGRLRDRRTDKDPSLAAIADRFERDVFAPLAKAGVARERLQLAWDFTTGSTERATDDLLRVVDLTRAWLTTNAPNVVVATTKDDGDFRTIDLTVTTPRFLDDGGGHARLVRDGDGRVVQNGTTTVNLHVVMPKEVRDASEAGRALAFGHGFFGGTDELDSGAGHTISSRLRAVLFGIAWLGMSKPDIGALADTLGDAPEHATDFAERVQQAMANWLVVTSLVRGSSLVEVAQLRRKDGGPAWDPSFAGYFGASQGHILGATLTAIDPDIVHAVLNVGGGGFVHIMPRSGAFGPLALVLRTTFADTLTRLLFIAMMQVSLDRIDPITWASRVGPRAIMQTGIGDNAVPNAASFLHARALGARLLVPSPRSVFGLSETTGGDSSPTITLFDYHLEVPTDAPLPQNPNPIHDTLRTNDAALRQMDAFLRTNGTVIQPCDGPCDPL